MKRKTTPICVCGIKSREVQPGVFECPRCQKLVEGEKPIKAPEGPIKVMGQDTYQTGPKVAKLTDTTKVVPCERCGTTVEDKCNVVCPNCKHINPCKTE
jgi:hypothetical protein